MASTYRWLLRRPIWRQSSVLCPKWAFAAATSPCRTSRPRSRWRDFLTTDGEKPWRDRDDEFVDTFVDRNELLQHWEAGWRPLFAALSSLTSADVVRTIAIRGEPHSIPLAASRSLAHTAYHIGQIVMVARILTGDDWKTLTIPRGESQQFNEQNWGSSTASQPWSDDP